MKNGQQKMKSQFLAIVYIEALKYNRRCIPYHIELENLKVYVNFIALVSFKALKCIL